MFDSLKRTETQLHAWKASLDELEQVLVDVPKDAPRVVPMLAEEAAFCEVRDVGLCGPLRGRAGMGVLWCDCAERRFVVPERALYVHYVTLAFDFVRGTGGKARAPGWGG